MTEELKARVKHIRSVVVWGFVVMASIALARPVATWLQNRELCPAVEQQLDAVYLVAGAREQDRRIEALVSFCNRSIRKPALILVGNDELVSGWSREEQKNLTMAEWAVKRIKKRVSGFRCQVSGFPASSTDFAAASRYQEDGGRSSVQSVSRVQAPKIEIIKARYSGTDGEMAILAGYLEQHPEIRSIALTTSPYHVRRAIGRLRYHVGKGVSVFALQAQPAWIDRAPWVVLGEVLKMGRDTLGLSHAPLLSRGTSPSPDQWAAGAMLVMMAVLLYAWGLYPLLLVILSRRVSSAAPGHQPTSAGGIHRMAVLLAAHNEEEVIRQRLKNLIQMQRQLPAGIAFSCHIGVDGSTDRTAAIAREFEARHPNIHVHDFEERRGKVAVLKDLYRRCDADILVFTDANTMFMPDALTRLISHFSGPAVGGVCGRLALKERENKSDSRARSDEGAYWRMETRLKEMESRLDSCLGANGAIYALRRELFWEQVPDNTVVDDFVIGMKVREQGKRMIYEPRAIAVEELPETRAEWKRRVRIGAGDYQALQLCRRCLSPKYGKFAWIFWSHKVLRWLTPHMGLVLVLGSWFFVLRCWAGEQGLFVSTVGIAVSAFIILFLVCAGVGRVARFGALGRVRVLGVFRLCDHFLTMQAALFVGFLRFCRGNLKGHWTRTPR